MPSLQGVYTLRKFAHPRLHQVCNQRGDWGIAKEVIAGCGWLNVKWWGQKKSVIAATVN